MKFFFLLFFPWILFADIQTCVNDYNEAVQKRKNALGSYKLAQSQKKAGDAKTDVGGRYREFSAAKDSTLAALDFFAQSETILKVVRRDCPESAQNMANELSKKNKGDISDVESFKKDVELILQIGK